jgi:hypothetical protein
MKKQYNDTDADDVVGPGPILTGVQPPLKQPGQVVGPDRPDKKILPAGHHFRKQHKP